MSQNEVTIIRFCIVVKPSANSLHIDRFIKLMIGYSYLIYNSYILIVYVLYENYYFAVDALTNSCAKR